MFQNQEIIMNIWNFGPFLCNVPEPSYKPDIKLVQSVERGNRTDFDL